MEYDFEKLGREIASGELLGSTTPDETAGDIARKLIVTGVMSTKARQDPRLTVAASCRGVLAAVMFHNQDLGRAAVAILKHVAEISEQTHIDPGELMTWSMEGIAAIAKLGGVDATGAVETAIEEKFQGAGGVFGDICRKPP